MAAIPAPCWLPVAFLWLGPVEGAVVFVVVMSTVFPIALGVRAGVGTRRRDSCTWPATWGLRMSLYIAGHPSGGEARRARFVRTGMVAAWGH